MFIYTRTISSGQRTCSMEMRTWNLTSMCEDIKHQLNRYKGTKIPWNTQVFRRKKEPRKWLFSRLFLWCFWTSFWCLKCFLGVDKMLFKSHFVFGGEKHISFLKSVANRFAVLNKLHCVGSALPVQQTRVVQNLKLWNRQVSGSTLFYL